MTPQQALAELQRTALMQPPPSVAVEAVGVLAQHIERSNDERQRLNDALDMAEQTLRRLGASDDEIDLVMATSWVTES